MAIDKITNSSITEIEKIMEAIYNVSHSEFKPRIVTWMDKLTSFS